MFYPALFGGPLSQHEVQLFALLARFGDLDNSDPMETAPFAFSSSCESASVLVDTIYGTAYFCLIDHLDHLARIHHER